ncbi:MAG: hypothetical protein QXM31_02925 [Candidatus Woesearchaeota archaeon]
MKQRGQWKMHGLEHICRHRKQGPFVEALVLAVIAAGSFAIIHQSFQHISYASNVRQNRLLSYESEKVRAFANSVRDKYPCPESLLDRDKDGIITEPEVLFYLKNQ